MIDAPALEAISPTQRTTMSANCLLIAAPPQLLTVPVWYTYNAALAKVGRGDARTICQVPAVLGSAGSPSTATQIVPPTMVEPSHGSEMICSPVQSPLPPGVAGS